LPVLSQRDHTARKHYDVQQVHRRDVLPHACLGSTQHLHIGTSQFTLYSRHSGVRSQHSVLPVSLTETHAIGLPYPQTSHAMSKKLDSNRVYRRDVLPHACLGGAQHLHGVILVYSSMSNLYYSHWTQQVS
jgi:hypothetical protein